MIFSSFEQVTDQRVIGRCRHSLSDILALVLIGVISDCDDFCEISDFGHDHIDVLRSDFGLSLSNGVPSEDTLERVFKWLNTKELEKAYQTFLGEVSFEGKQICLDGKELRSTIEKGKKHASVQMVNAWVHDLGISFGQTQVSEKSNEITAIPTLLESVDCKGAVVTIDAIGCQKKIVADIIEKKADYVIGLKENQKGLYQDCLQEFTREAATLLSAETSENGHGRRDVRKTYVSHQLKWLERKAEWEGLKSIIMVERTRTIGEETTVSKKVYISSIDKITPEQAQLYVRNHWGIENGLHWQLDFTFNEDSAVLADKTAIANLHVIRKWALMLLKRIPGKISGKRKRKQVSRNLKLFAQMVTEKND